MKKNNKINEIMNEYHFKKSIENFKKEKGYKGFQKVIKALGKM